MEVHKHPHHVTDKKKWGEYFLEFFMLFLAVFLGFIAENIRENIAERQREKEYMNLLAQDLKKDTAALNYSLRRLSGDLRYGDSIIISFVQSRLEKKPDSTILQWSVFCGLSVDIIFNDRAASQLKNSGSMRLIKEKTVANAILEYWNQQIKVREIHDRFENIRIEHHKIAVKTFNWYVAYYSIGRSTDSSLYTLPVRAIRNPENLTEFINTTSILYNSGVTQYTPALIKQKTLAAELIDLIQKHYQIKGE